MAPKRKSYSIEDKITAIEWIRNEGSGVPSRAEKHFGELGWSTKANTFRKWWRNRERICSQRSRKVRCIGGGRKPLLGNIEELVVNEVIKRRIRKKKLQER